MLGRASKKRRKPTRCAPAKKRRRKSTRASAHEEPRAALSKRKAKRKPKRCRTAKAKRKPAPKRRRPAPKPRQPVSQPRQPAPKPSAPQKPAPKPSAPQKTAPDLPPAPPPPTGRPGPPPNRVDSPLPVYTGTFGRAEAERLLWRAGFGPSPGWVDSFVALGLAGAVDALVSPQGAETFTGPEPSDMSGNPLAPEDGNGHDHLWWLDRMVRTNQPFLQRMALIWHDWFATSNQGVGSQRLMLDQIELFRAHGRGSFEQLLRKVTVDPAMLLWLNGIQNRKGAINENYARELMELFTLGADRGAYTETDVRQMARALSGWRADHTSELGWHNFRFDPARWDSGQKTILGQTGAFGWEDAYKLCLYHDMHPTFFVEKLWSYFLPEPPSESDRASLEATYVNGGHQILPLVRAILMHPRLYEGPKMVKPPVVYAAGLMRGSRHPVNHNDFRGYCEQAGQRLFYPPDVSGWNDEHWLDTNTMRARWGLVWQILRDTCVNYAEQPSYDPAETPQQAVGRAIAYWGHPPVSAECRASLLDYAASCLPSQMTNTGQSIYRAQRQNALRHLIGVSGDLQVC